MFKSTFVKYVVAFALILAISFVILSGIITATVKNYITENSTEELERTCLAVSSHLSDNLLVEDLEAHVASGMAARVLMPLLGRNSNMDIMLTDDLGRVLLTTHTDKNTGEKRLIYQGELGEVDLNKLDRYDKEDGQRLLIFNGVLDKQSGKNVRLCAKTVHTNNAVRGYVLVLSDIEQEDLLYRELRQTITRNALWLMLAAFIAVYFVSERIVHPLKEMKAAAKSFAEGDFSTRVKVYGKDEISELAEAFNNMAQSLDSFDKMRNSFLANVSHDLRTPMTTISGFIDGITSGAIPPEKHGYYLNIISGEVHRLSRLVSDLLDISRLESGDRKFSFTQFNICEIARLILLSFEQKIEEKRLDVIFEADDDDIEVIGDKDAIHQVVYNLCDNAIKFAKEGGKFAISITATENKKIRFSVFDEGQSISGEDLNLVFDRFYKTDKSRGLDKNGVGLGLYICKTIIDAHGEEIHAESPSDNGAEFWFTLKTTASKKQLITS